MKLPFKKLRPDAIVPTRAHDTDSGVDLYVSEAVELTPHKPTAVGCGVACAIPAGHEGQIRPRSSASRGGILISLGTIDEGYRGELVAIATNLENYAKYIDKGTRIAQFVVVPIIRPTPMEVTDFEDRTDRNERGWGSTGE